ncbi:ribosome maturation factor RimP [Polynucleobacter paneuropaeus]|uniref:Ribosome maturation factor RimP n=1 Tax=Polynucleobacter paneuropaeus TaxID=2527775 RepID=A0ABX9FEI3_9BURK|nr:ribosome maturation factor RimP [Polynucleobacter paneuropaeus]MBT8525085.1 ribosome maturation factor RimP [Polynucleobacter paneuropaeus]MBT8570729.1 ribosome maturation factor RimP [Polynucleobacter paneuropaeus]MBT8580246.1 ribosome maturation factor RimP [Polynucleobacter paneuropaeus]MBT8588409.1 ribosome maturation factor RimP [Polynucleobacter paneuropaeus]MBT8601077.1 ribosome maturation factor RimP [Polynucleobacter paneuropaeus]
MRDQQIISAELQNLGYALVDIEREAGGLLRVTIENPDYERLITVEDCEKVSHQLSYALPVENIPYERLEISSPGLDRPVKSAEDFVRFAGLEVDLKLRIAVGSRKNFRGVLQGLLSGDVHSPDAKFGLMFEGTDGAESQLEFSLAEVDKTRLVPVIDFKGRKS